MCSKLPKKVELSDGVDLYKHWHGVDSIFTLSGLTLMRLPCVKWSNSLRKKKAPASPGISEHLAPFITAGKPARYHIIKQDLYHHIE